MPIMPPSGVPGSGEEPHRNRHIAESFGSDAERYDRARPRYPDAMVERIAAASPGADVLDVGTGTGIAARQFQAVGCRVLGVEPDTRMAEFARRNGLEVEVATFEAWSDEGRSFDTVLAGQAWHWVDPVAGAARAAEVLRPGGRLAVFWNDGQVSPELAEAFAAVYRRVMPGSLASRRWTTGGSDGCSVLCARAVDGMRATGEFGDPEQWQSDWSRVYTRNEWLDQLPTQGGHAQLPRTTLDEVQTGVGAAIDAMGGSFTMHYTTEAVVAARTGAAR